MSSIQICSHTLLESNTAKVDEHSILNCLPLQKKVSRGAVSTERTAFLGIEPFWERPTLESPLKWERYRLILKLAILAKNSISIDILREPPPVKVTFTPEPIYEEDVDNSTAQIEIAGFTMNNLKLHGLTIATKMRRREYCAAIDRGNFVIPKLSCLRT